MTLRDQILRSLERLGDDPAAVLRRHGVKGWRGSAVQCPLYNYLGWLFPDVSFVCVTTATAHYKDRVGSDYVRLPEPCRRLIQDFDGGLLPDLNADLAPVPVHEESLCGTP